MHIKPEQIKYSLRLFSSLLLNNMQLFGFADYENCDFSGEGDDTEPYIWRKKIHRSNSNIDDLEDFDKKVKKAKNG